MKQISLLFGIISFCINSSGQNGVQRLDTLFLSDSSFYVKGHTVDIGPGSKSNGGYAYISTKPEKIGKQIVMPLQLTSGWEGYKMKIVDFELIGTEISGKKYYLVLTIFDQKEKFKLYYICDPILAKKSKEIL